MFACLHGTGNLKALAFEFSPLVEQAGPHTVVLDVSGLDHLFGWPQDIAAAIARRAQETSASIRIALAANPDAAICAARGLPGVQILPQGDEAKFLGPLPLSLLEPSLELMETLERWGIRRFRDLAALPPLGIAERLGPEGLRLRELARGEVDRKLVPIMAALQFEDEMALEYPVDLLEPLLFLLSRMLHSITMRLSTRALATNELRLHLRLEDRTTHTCTLRLPVPALNVQAFLKLMQLDLEAKPPRSPVIHIHVEANPAKPRTLQTGLYLSAAPQPIQLQITVARIQAIVGEGRVGSPELIDTHRPDAFRMVEFGQARAVPCSSRVQLACCVFRPPLPATVTVDRGSPTYIASRGIRGQVLEHAGPWLSSGDWWTESSWEREEWDVGLSDGALYRIYREPRGWFVEGRYD